MAVFDCPTCGAHRDDVPDSYVGKAVKCKQCGESIRVGGEEAGPGPPAPPKVPPSTSPAPQVRPLWPLNDDETITARLMLADMAYNQRTLRLIFVVGKWVLIGLLILFAVSVVYGVILRKAA